MSYIVLGGLALLVFLWATRGKPLLKRREWRFVTGAFALAAFVAAVALGVRGSWGTAIVLVVVGMWLLTATRQGGPAPAAAPATRMGQAEARRILGVEEGASRKDIQAAYTRLMRMAHPDKGGTAGLAAQLNAARDRLLQK